jgi:hypothetical protein
LAGAGGWAGCLGVCTEPWQARLSRGRTTDRCARAVAVRRDARSEATARVPRTSGAKGTGGPRLEVGHGPTRTPRRHSDRRVARSATRPGTPGAPAALQSAAMQHSSRSTHLRLGFSPKIRIEVHKVVNRKVVALTTLYNFRKGSRVFFSMDFAGTSCQLGMSACPGKQEVLAVDQVFR